MSVEGECRRHVVVVEPNLDGHRLGYVVHIARAALRKGHRVTVATSSRHAKAALEHLMLAGHECQVVPLGDRLSSRGIVKAFDADLTVVPDGDRLAVRLGASRVVGWGGRGRLSLLVMRWPGRTVTQSAFARIVATLKYLAIMRASHLRGVRVSALVSATGWETGLGVSTVRDPVECVPDLALVAEFRDSWHAGPDSVIVGVVGALDRRKNLGMVLEAVVRAGRREVKLVLAGRLDPDLRHSVSSQIDDAQRRGFGVHLYDRVLDDVELDSIVAAMDYVVLAHSNEGPSGILGKAAAVGTSVLAAGAESLKRDIFALGRDGDAWSDLTAEALKAEILRIKPTTRTARQPLAMPSSDDFASALLGDLD